MKEELAGINYTLKVSFTLEKVMLCISKKSSDIKKIFLEPSAT